MFLERHSEQIPRHFIILELNTHKICFCINITDKKQILFIIGPHGICLNAMEKCVKCKISPEHKVHAKLYAATMITSISVICHDCLAFKEAASMTALLMWVHCRSEETPCNSVLCYWMKWKLYRFGTRMKFMTALRLVKQQMLACYDILVIFKF